MLTYSQLPLKNKFLWNLDENTKLYFQGIAFETVCKMVGYFAQVSFH